MRVAVVHTQREDMAQLLRGRGLPLTEDALEEYDSRATVLALMAAIQVSGHTVSEIPWGGELPHFLDYTRPDLVFNIAEGFGGRCREAQVPALLDMRGIPYVGGDTHSLAISLDKAATNIWLAACGCPVPFMKLVSNDAAPDAVRGFREEFPLIVKPSREGSSRGIFEDSVVSTELALDAAVARIHEQYRQPALIEEFLGGREFTVGLVGDPLRVLGVMEVRSSRQEGGPFVYTLGHKREWRERVEYVVEPKLPPGLRDNLVQTAVLAARALGCRDMARVDLRERLGPVPTPCVIEVNPLPGLNPQSSDLVLLARGLGFSYESLIAAVLKGAAARVNMGRCPPRD